MQTPSQALPWYKQFWPWFIIALPATAVVAGITTLVLATRDPDGLVNDDYYKQGLLINQVMDKERQAQTLGLGIELQEQGRQLQLRLFSRGLALPPQSLSVLLAHPTRANRDQHIQVAYDAAAGAYILPLQSDQGDWDLVVEPSQGQWRMVRRIRLPLLQPYTFSYN